MSSTNFVEAYSVPRCLIIPRNIIYIVSLSTEVVGMDEMS